MIERRKLKFSNSIFFCAVLFSALAASAQPIEDREPLRRKASVKTVGVKSTVRRPPPKKRTSDSSLLVKSRTKTPKVPADRTSDLTIETETNAKVTMTLQPAGRGLKPVEITETAVNGKAVFENLKPGKYSLSAVLENYVEQETELTIEPQKTATLNFQLEPIKYQLNIETNIPDGEVRYAPADKVGENPDGSVRLQPDGNYCIVQIKNKKATITGLKKDYYTIDINPSRNALQYEPVKAAITPDLIVDEEDEKEGLSLVNISLETKISTTAFAPSLRTAGEWSLPGGWKVQDKMSNGGVNGIALPSSKDLYGYYTDFELISIAKLLDGKTIGFVARLIDAQNYYYFQIAGGKAAGRYLLTGYLVKDGTFTQLNSYDISAFDSVLEEKKSFRVIIRGTGNSFLVLMDDKRGDPQPLGTITDAFGNFRKGAAGIAERNGSNIEVNFFTVCPLSCMK